MGHKTSIVHVSDLHLRAERNPVTARTQHIAAAIGEADIECRDYVIVLSGDITNQGLAVEYDVAKQFLREIRAAIETSRPGSAVHFLSVPGNHDCVLPESGTALRNALIEGLRATLHTPKPDSDILDMILASQEHYFDFTKELFGYPEAEVEKICGRRLIRVCGEQLLFTLYNTALLSRRNEEQGLMVPIELMRSAPAIHQDSSISIAVFHHPYYWLDPNDSIEFRNHIDRTSDIALTGHQHVEHGFVKHSLMGDIVFYSEGHALQEQNRPGDSAFRVIVLDLEKQTRRVVSYQWKKSLYLPSIESDWTPYYRPHSRSVALSPSADFLTNLSDSGIGLTHSITGPLTLDTFFVWPDVVLRRAGSFDTARDLSGSALMDYLSTAARILVEGSAFAGKSALAQAISKEWLRTRSFYPLLLSGKGLQRAALSNFEALIDSEASKAYGADGVAKYRQLPLQSRALVIDDWDQLPLTNEAKDELIVTASSHFGKVLLFSSNISYVDQFMDRLDPKTEIAKYDLLALKPLSFVARGQLIEKWVSMELSKSSPDFSRRVEETERLLDTVIGRNTLPSIPFIVLSLLEASQRNREKIPDNGSFGYLYEVLVTSALNISLGAKSQLDRKYQFLSLLAFRMFTDGLDSISVRSTQELLDEYATSWIIKLDKAALLRDLEYSRVLVQREGHYRFGYGHYFHYFLARYFKNNFTDPQVRSLLSAILRGLNVGSNGTFLMFVVYLTNNDESLTKELLEISERILGEFEPSTFTDEVEFYNSKDQLALEVSVETDSIDLEKSRQERRESADAAKAKEGDHATASQLNLFLANAGYSDDLPTGDKLTYGARSVEILGQILRNFTGALHGDQKLAILDTTYRLGLRISRAILTNLSGAAARARDVSSQLAQSQADVERFQKLVERYLSVLTQITGFSLVSMISGSVGSPDIEGDAYSQTLNKVGRNNATELVNLAIKLDHAGPDDYPLPVIKELYRKFENNRFAQQVLVDLVVANMYVFDIGRETRQRVLAALRIKAPSEAMLSRKNKRLRDDPSL